MKTCPKCKENREECEFLDRNQNVVSTCKNCRRLHSQIYYKNHPEKKKIHKKKYDLKTRPQQNKYQRNRIHKVRDEFLTMYGNKCLCCGESLKEFLTIDHIKGQKGIKKKEVSIAAYKKALKEYNPTEYRILCMNCNHSMGTKGYCPHRTFK